MTLEHLQLCVWARIAATMSICAGNDIHALALQQVYLLLPTVLVMHSSGS
jgi:hypothetical protein